MSSSNYPLFPRDRQKSIKSFVVAVANLNARLVQCEPNPPIALYQVRSATDIGPEKTHKQVGSPGGQCNNDQRLFGFRANGPKPLSVCPFFYCPNTPFGLNSWPKTENLV